MSDSEVFRAVLDARRAWSYYLDATEEDEEELYEAYLETATEAIPYVGGLIELCVEANLIAISAHDAIIEIAGDIVLGHSDELPSFERRSREEDEETRFNRAREVFREMNRPNVSRAVEELRALREEALRGGQSKLAEKLSHVLGLLQISPPRLTSD